MTPGERTALIVVGGTVAAGALYSVGVLLANWPNPLAPKPPAGTPSIVPWPQTTFFARKSIINLDTLWYENSGNAPYQAQLNQEATAIRLKYPRSGNTNRTDGQYTCCDLQQLGMLPGDYCASHNFSCNVNEGPPAPTA